MAVDDLDVFYREAGPVDAPVLVLLHGYPTSSHMFRHLIPALSGSYRVIAPDHIGFGRSAAPSVEDFDYTFDSLASVTTRFLEILGIATYTIYVQDYGAPIGWRLALASPGSVEAVISQNGNAYEDGFVSEFWDPIWAYGDARTPENEAVLRPALGREAVEWQYKHGVPDETTVDPDAWEHDLALLGRVGVDRAQLSLFADYGSNRQLYPAVHEWLRTSKIPVLAIWGENDEIFAAAGAWAFLADAPHARVELFDGGHFLLESNLDDVVRTIEQWRSAQLSGVAEMGTGDQPR